MICISDNKNKELVAKVMSQQAEVFDEIIIDDFWSNWCYSHYDIELFNEKFGFQLTEGKLLKALVRGDPVITSLWATYSSDLVYEVSKDFVIDPAKRVNPKLKITLKVAEWREDFYHRGLMLSRLKNIFDNIYVGTESREGTERYGSFYIVNFIRSIVKDKLLGAWFDQGNGFDWSVPTSVRSYIEQAWLSILSPIKEVTLFHAGSLMRYYDELTVHLSRKLKEIVEVRKGIMDEEAKDLGLLGIKVPAIQPMYAESSDRYIEDFLGMIGIPLKPDNEINEGDYVLITDKFLKQGDLFSLIDKKANILLTSSASEYIAKEYPELGFELLEDVIHARAFVKTESNAFYSSEHRRQSGFPVGPIINAKNISNVLLSVTDGEEIYPIIFEVKYRDSSIYVLNVTKYAPYLVEYYPEIVRQTIRDIAFNYLGFGIESLMPIVRVTSLLNVSLIPYRDNVLILNLNDYDISFILKVNRKKYTLLEENFEIEEKENLSLAKIRVSKDSAIKVRLKKTNG